jgi:hypothetical protein
VLCCSVTVRLRRYNNRILNRRARVLFCTSAHMHNHEAPTRGGHSCQVGWAVAVTTSGVTTSRVMTSSVTTPRLTTPRVTTSRVTTSSVKPNTQQARCPTGNAMHLLGTTARQHRSTTAPAPQRQMASMIQPPLSHLPSTARGPGWHDTAVFRLFFVFRI